jgi:hypothetical protein
VNEFIEGTEINGFFISTVAFDRIVNGLLFEIGMFIGD